MDIDVQKVQDAIDTYDRAAEFIGSCVDGNCVVLKPIGMHTNGGCRCWTDKMKAQRMMLAGRNLRDALRVKIGQPPTE